MKGPLYRQSLKAYTRQVISMNRGLCMRASACVVAIGLLLTTIQMNFGHPLTYMILSLADNAGVKSGLQVTGAGIAGALRLDPAGLILAMQITWPQLALFLLEALVVLLLTVPVTYGALEQFFGMLHRRMPTMRALFRWYGDLRLVFRSMTVELVLTLVQWILRILGMAPGLYLFARTIGAADGSASNLNSLSGGLMLLGMVAAYILSCQLDPIRYFLANDPGLGVAGAFRKGWASLRGRRLDYFWFAFSFIGWELISMFTYGLGDIYLLPYRSMASALYLGIAVPEGSQGGTVNV